MKIDPTVNEYLRMNPDKCPDGDALFRYNPKTGTMIQVAGLWLVVAHDNSVGIVTRPHTLRQASRMSWDQVGSGADAEVWSKDNEFGFLLLPLNPSPQSVFGKALSE